MDYKPLFKKYVERYPGLYLYLSESVNEPHDYGVAQESDWAPDLYKIMADCYEGALAKVDMPIKAILEKVDPARRGMELERTMMNLIVLNAVLEDNYEFFRNTPVGYGECISHDQFNHFRNLIIHNFSGDKIRLLECALVMGDYGKVAALRRATRDAFEIHSSDPDDYLKEILSLDQAILERIFPGIGQFNRSEFYDFRALKSGIHFGQLSQGEVQEKELYKLKTLFDRHHEEYFYQQFVVQLLDIAGAMGHISGRVMLNRDLFEIYVNCLLSSLKQLKTKSPEDVYHDYLYHRAAMVNLRFSMPEEMSWSETFSLRLLCLLRITREEDAKDLFDVLDLVWLDERFTADAEYILDYQKRHETATYLPALFHSLKDHYMPLQYKKKVLGETVRKGVHIIASSFRLHDKLIRSNILNNKQRVNFNELSYDLRNHPELIEKIQSEQDLVIQRSDISVHARNFPAGTQSEDDYLDYYYAA